ncbi:MAG TPA: aldose 1-epimerase family protein [Gaiellaceae bacterium]|nr:aldose 1-epimerase family protein [Gaiellaceae bacterium]
MRPPELAISHDDQHAAVDLTGGGLRAYAAGGRDVLDGYGPDEESTSGRGQVLIPWPNRLEDGTYEFNGTRHELPLTEPDRGNAIHGLVRRKRWTVAEHVPERIALEHALEPQPGYPFSIALTVEYTLSAIGLGVRSTAANVGSETCPYGAGFHPYLTSGTQTVDTAGLRIPARTVLISDERGLPIGEQSVDQAGLDFRQPRQIGSTVLDHAFTDLDRDDDGLARVELVDSQHGAVSTLWVDETFSFLMVFTGDPLSDVARRSLAVEPMTCPPNAFRTGDHLIRLEPGASATSAWGITPARLDRSG